MTSTAIAPSDPSAVAEPAGGWSARHFGPGVVGIALVALVWRIFYVTIVVTNNPTAGDGFYYHQQANLLAEGHGFANPFIWQQSGTIVGSAQHPPLYTLVLAFVSFVGGDSFLAHKLISCLVGAGTVVVIGLVGRRIGGPRAGLIAAGLAAAYPNLWLIDSLILSEDLFALTIGLTILAAYRLRDSPRAVNGILLGGAIALAALTRGEAIFLIVLLAAPLLLLTRSLSLWHQVRLIAIVGVTMLVVIAPWVARNMTAFERPVYLSSNTDGVLSVANCDQTYYGKLLGFWSFACDVNVPGDESVRALASRKKGLHYMREHAGRVPIVVAARVGRVWDVFRPWQNALAATLEGRPLWGARLGLFVYWLMVPFAVVGAWLVHRRRITLIPLVAQVVLVTLIAAGVYGAVRFRLPAEVVILSLAAVALDVGIASIARSRRSGAVSTAGDG